MFEDLITYEGLDEACADAFGFSGVVFKRDFGPWKQGDKAESLWFILERSIAEEQTNDGKVVKNCKFQLQAIS